MKTLKYLLCGITMCALAYFRLTHFPQHFGTQKVGFCETLVLYDGFGQHDNGLHSRAML